MLEILTGFFHSVTRITERNALIEGFQETQDLNSTSDVPEYKQNFRSRVFVAITGVKGVGFILTISVNLIKFEHNYSAGTDKQVFKRKYRIRQHRACTIWKLLAKDSVDEQAVFLRAQRKASFIVGCPFQDHSQMDN